MIPSTKFTKFHFKFTHVHTIHSYSPAFRNPSHRPNSAVSAFGQSASDTAFLVGSRNVGTLRRTSQVVEEYEPSYGPNESTLKRMKAKQKEAEIDEEYDYSGYNPMYIDDDDDDY